MIEEKDIKVEEITYRIKGLLASDHYTFLSELGQMTGGLLTGVGIDNNIDFGKVVTGLFLNATPEKLASLMKRLFQKSIAVPNMDKDEKYELHFGKNFHHVPALFEEILKFNYGLAFFEIKKKLGQSSLFAMILAMLFQQREKNQNLTGLEKSISDYQNTNSSANE